MRGPRLPAPIDTETIEMGRLQLRRWHWYLDRAAYRRLYETTRFGVGWPQRTTRQVHEHLRHRGRHTRLWQDDDFIALAVVHNGVVIGDVSMHLRGVAEGLYVGEMGWAIMPQFQGRGFAREAASTLMTWVRDLLPMDAFIAVIAAGNTPSDRVAMSLGMTEAGHRNGAVIYRMSQDSG